MIALHKPLILNILKKIGGIYILYTLCRILFYFFNRSYFNGFEFSEFIQILFYGLRFDTFSIAATNSLFILLSVLPFKFYYSKWYQLSLKYIFITTNAFFILLNLVDLAYFPFTHKRSNLSLLKLVFSNQIDIISLLPFFILNYWYVVVMFILILWLVFKYYNFIQSNQTPKLLPVTIKNVSIHFLLVVLFFGITILGIRGGVQRVPIVLLDAAQYSKPQNIPILLNTPFTLLKSTEWKELQPLSILEKKLENSYFNPIHKKDTSEFKNCNVFVVILESFSKEFTCIGNRKSYTPFLDSLMKHSLVFSNAYANGKTSIDGIPAVISSIPNFMYDPYINSAYSNNLIQSLPNLLKTKGYRSTFFHGGTNGTMNFNSFAKIAGYDNYYGRAEYNNENDYDGQWGIWDHAFLKNIPQQVANFKEPFFASLFTLSSHSPYSIPDKYKNKFPKGNYEITESIGYADYSLRLFFEECRKQPWFNNTLFVFTADHTSASEDLFYANIIGQHSIPLFFYKNNELSGNSTKTVQQIDILPTVLDYLNYDNRFYSFGQSMFSNKNNPIVFYSSPNFYIVKDSVIYNVLDYKISEHYNYIVDSALKNPLPTASIKNHTELLNYTKAYIQRYTNDIINNTTHISNP